jgi:hypothetical protein
VLGKAVDLILTVYVGLMGLGSAHFVCEALVFLFIALWLMVCIQPKRSWLRSAWLATVCLCFVLMCVPIDIAARNGTKLSISWAEVYRGSDGLRRLEGLPVGETTHRVRYRGQSLFVSVRRALLITVPTQRRIYTPLFVDGMHRSLPGMSPVGRAWPACHRFGTVVMMATCPAGD